MRGAARTIKDKAGGVIIGILAPNVFTNGVNQSVIGDPVKPHGSGEHGSPVMMTGSPNVYAHGIPCCREGDLATCLHPSTGSPNVKIN